MPYYPGAGQTWSNQFNRTHQIPYPVYQPFTLTNNFDGLPTGTTVTTGNLGGVSGNKFDSVVIGAQSSITTDATFAAHGINAVRIATGASAVTDFIRWSAPASFVIQPTIWFRFNFLCTAYPAGNVRIYGVSNPAANTNLCAAVQLLTTGQLRWINAVGSTISTTTNVLSPGQWVRVEGFIYGSSTAGQMELKLFTNIESNTPTETIGGSSNTFDWPAFHNFGSSSSIANYGPFWFDDVGITNTGYMGPATFPTYVPQLESQPGSVWQKNYQHRQSTYLTVPDAYVGAPTGNVSVFGQSDNTITESVSVTANINVSGQSDNTVARLLSGATPNVSVAGQSDNTVTESMIGSVSNVGVSGQSGLLSVIMSGANSAVNVSGQSDNLLIVSTGASPASISVVALAGVSTDFLIGTTGQVNAAAVSGNVQIGGGTGNVIGATSTVIVSAYPGGFLLTNFFNPSWWRVYRGYGQSPVW